MTTIKIPELSLVVLIGAAGSGKSTFAARRFRPTEVLSSDAFRAMVSDDENDQSATRQAFEALHFVAARRLEFGRLAVVDATNVDADARRPLVALAREHHVLPVAIVLDVEDDVCLQRNAARTDRSLPAAAVRRQREQLSRALRGLEREGFRRVFVLRGAEAVDAAQIAREPAWSDRRAEQGPFDLIGDVHGCREELADLLGRLGYARGGDGAWRHPDGRRAVFVGDLVDRGPDTPGVLRMVMDMVEAGTALSVTGNHEHKMLRALQGRKVRVSHGLEISLAQLEREPEQFRARVANFLDGLISHYVLDGGRLVVAHAGLPEQMHGRASGAVRAFAMYGETTGETDEFGLPVRYPWARDYRGKAAVVYGHTPATEAVWVNNTICLDTGCVFGGKLTALRYPERELVSVPARAVHYEPARPLGPPPAAAGQAAPGSRLVEVADVLGRRRIETSLRGPVTIAEENSAAALEVMSRFAIDPRWLIYLPPTMAPAAASERPRVLEHPEQALAHYRRDGVARVVCEEKHMGSRAVAVVCRTPEAAREWFGADRPGAVYTRTGRRFFADPALEEGLLARLSAALQASGLWAELGDWAALDCEILPWSLKAGELVREQYARVGAAASAWAAAAAAALDAALARGADVAALRERTAGRQAAAAAFARAYRPYVWPTAGLDGIRVAPFTLLAGSAGVLLTREHTWHMAMAERLAQADPLLITTRHVVADLDDPAAERDVAAWWEELVGAGGEGVVVKPADPVTRGKRGLVQPGVKCRGPEYLRLIYGPEYDGEANLARLRQRNLGRKRSLALGEFALGVEALERFVRREPAHRVHECVFGVLALESDPVDPRL